jgi:hypothetical protein
MSEEPTDLTRWAGECRQCHRRVIVAIGSAMGADWERRFTIPAHMDESGTGLCRGSDNPIVLGSSRAIPDDITSYVGAIVPCEGQDRRWKPPSAGLSDPGRPGRR